MAKKDYTVLLEDEHLLIVNKRSGLLTIPDRYRADIPNLYHKLQAVYGEIYIVHRLDKGTSGLICFAKTKEAHRLLSLQFEAREPVKRYYAIVQGVPFEKEGIIDVGLSPNKEGGMHVDIKRGKPSVTEYQVIEAFGQFSLVEATILTGRTHQIRIHFKHLGHPLAVDALYANKSELYLSEIKRKRFNLKKNTDERPLLSRVPLHAHSLKLLHPVTNEPIDINCEVPKDMRAILSQLRKWSKKN
ncbi:RluA family pseudouridine synthase [Aureispira anguillae]|uniref:Pseudouridine synthase n=1 Tax=Aureispira anguillae TaxID=2864201 RepID=A0A916DR51_9BACT|nr:RluA family pseudouridine synthase [Aureispira anguillae]BDS11076.1 RluA family pseudouridine synthase [Aureispira anguillae]